MEKKGLEVKETQDGIVIEFHRSLLSKNRLEIRSC